MLGGGDENEGKCAVEKQRLQRVGSAGSNKCRPRLEAAAAIYDTWGRVDMGAPGERLGKADNSQQNVRTNRQSATHDQASTTQRPNSYYSVYTIDKHMGEKTRSRTTYPKNREMREMQQHSR